MYHYGILTSFDHTSNSWSIYKSRINQWFIANDITTSTDDNGVKRRGILLSALSEKSYILAVDLALPEDIQDVPFQDIIKLLDAHFTPKRLGFTERFKFYSALQNVLESNAEFIARLRGLSRYCEFKDAEEALRDRFVLGLRPGPARDKLFEQKLDELTLANALEIAERASCVQEVNDAQKWRLQPFFGGTKAPPYQPPFFSGTMAQPGHGPLFGAQSGQGSGTTQLSGSTTFGATQSSPAASFGRTQTQAGQAGLFGTQTQSSPTFGGKQTGQAAFGGPKPPEAGSLFGIPKPQTEQATLRNENTAGATGQPLGQTVSDFR